MKTISATILCVLSIGFLSYFFSIEAKNDRNFLNLNNNISVKPTPVPCENPPTQGLNTTWRANSTVNYLIDPSFDATERGIIEAQLNSWRNAGGINITFSNTSGGGVLVSGIPQLFISSEYPSVTGRQGETSGNAFNGCRGDTFMRINPDITDTIAFTQVVSHELGHTFGLDDCITCAQDSTAMTRPTSGGINGRGGTDGPTTCDSNQVRVCPAPTPTPPPVPTGCASAQIFNGTACPFGFSRDTTTGYYCCQTGCTIPETDEFCTEQRNECEINNGSWKGCCRGCFSPIVLDIEGNGFNLTDGNNGVLLDLTGEGTKDKVSWTAADSDDAWLVLDRNNNGTVDNALELFGNFTAQDPAIPVKDRNGFSALAEYDKTANGGNGDGRINRQDTIYQQLRLWQDKNHNGISEPAELKTLQDLDVRAIFLDFKVSKKKDEHGNRFVYRARVRDKRDADVGKWAWDVFLVRPK